MGNRFEAIVGAAHVAHPGGETLCGARVEAVVRPASAAEVAACLRAATESGTAIVPVGGGSKLGFGNPLEAPACIRLELGRLCERMELDADEGIAELDAGIALDSLARSASALGKVTAFDPLHRSATVGGAIAVDPVSPEASLDARLRNDLLGLEVALANGEVTRAGGRVVKNVTGFDLVRLYCGSFGSLGVVTRAIVRLRAAPERVAVTRERFASLDAALAAAARAALAGAGASAAVRPADGGAELVSRLAACAAEVESQLAHVSGEPCGSDLWSALRGELARPPAPGTARVRLGARPSDVAFLCHGLAAAAGAAALRLVLPRAGIVFGMAEHGALSAIAERAERAGATFAIERAPGSGPVSCDAFGAPPPALAAMRGLKARFDPARVLSPGRFVAGI
ncbi:MAG: FAD-binding oxidoreductase [Myxococcota bacterium]